MKPLYGITLAGLLTCSPLIAQDSVAVMEKRIAEYASIEGYCKRGEIEKSFNPELSQKSFKKATEIEAKTARDFALQGRAYTELKQYLKAFDSLQKAKDINPDDGTFLHQAGYLQIVLGKWDHSIIYFRREIELYPQSYGTYVTLGNLLVEKDPKASQEVFEDLLKINPGKFQNYYQYAIALASMGEKEKSKEMLKIASELNPDFTMDEGDRKLLEEKLK